MKVPFPSLRRLALRTGACVALLAAPAMAETLSMGVSAGPASIDPHYYTLTPNVMVAAHMFDALVAMDANSRPQPQLAETWRLLDDTTWEFRLRGNVTFHDGTPLTAEDVAFTLQRIPNVQSPGPYTVYTRGVAGVEVVDARTIRLKTAAPYPLLPNDMAQIRIIPRSLGLDVPSSDFNSGKAAIGTGPFRFVSYTPNDRVRMVRNDAYWGEKPIWDQVDYRILTNAASRVAALVSGDVAMIDNVPTPDIAKLRRDSRLTLAEGPTLRMIYIGLDQHSDEGSPEVTGPNGEALDRNPLRDRRVREAMSIAINRTAIVQRVMEGAAVASGQFMPAGSFGYAPDIQPPPFDQARAKQLLADAGYPDGFTIVLRGPNDRYVNDGQIAQAVAQMWSRIGIRTRVDTGPLAALIGRLNRFETSAHLIGYGSGTGEASASLRAILGTRNTQIGLGTLNFARYSNPRVDEITAEALRTMDNERREILLQDAMRIAMAETGVIPLHLQMGVWGLRKGLTYTPRIDELTLATGVGRAR